MQKQQTANQFASIEEDRPQAPVQTRPTDPAAARTERSANRELFLRASGYEILEDGPTKTLKVNRDWIAGKPDASGKTAPDNARWLLFVGDAKPLPVFEALFLDETQTETEVVAVGKTVQYGCSTRQEMTQVKSAYMITMGRVAYRIHA